MPSHAPIAWSEAQRRVLVFLLLVVVAYLGFRMWRDNSAVGDPQPARPAREMELADRIDPNTADVATLAALPGLGMKRAADIVAFREQYNRWNPGKRAFSRLEDLLKIDGIGYAMMMQLAPHFMFPPTTQPSAHPQSSGVIARPHRTSEG